jgi:hypothetical protein
MKCTIGISFSTSLFLCLNKDLNYDTLNIANTYTVYGMVPKVNVKITLRIKLNIQYKIINSVIYQFITTSSFFV